MKPLLLASLSVIAACSGTPGGQSDSGLDCGATFCGCSEDVSIDVSTTIWNGQMDTPVEGATLTCLGEDSPRGTSEADGVIAFQLETRESPGCGLEDCNNVLIAVENSGLVALETSLDAILDQVVTLQYGND